MGKSSLSPQFGTLERGTSQAWRRPGKDSTQSHQSHCGAKNWTVVTGVVRLWGQMSLFGFRLCPNSHVMSDIAHISCSFSLCDFHSSTWRSMFDFLSLGPSNYSTFSYGYQCPTHHHLFPSWHIPENTHDTFIFPHCILRLIKARTKPILGTSASSAPSTMPCISHYLRNSC